MQNLYFKIDLRNLTIFIRALKSLKNIRFNVLLLSKVYIVWAKKVQRSYLSWYFCKIWRKTVLLFAKWCEEFGKFSSEHWKVSKLELWWVYFVQSRKCMSLKFTEELCVMKMKNDTKIEGEMNFRFKIDMRNLTSFHSSTRKSKKILF